MENKDIVIIASIVVILYLAYQNQENSQSSLIVESPITQQLRSELSHYQTLYENRVKKDLAGNQAQEIQQLNQQLEQTVQDYQEINEELIQTKEYNQLYQQKITDLETSLLNLAKQKLKGKKD